MSVSGNQQRGVVFAAGTAVATAGVSLATSSTWYQLVASTSSNVLLVSVHLQSASGGTTLDIGIGGAGSETVVMQLYCVQSSESFALTIPIRVASGTRIAARHSSIGSGIYVSVQYVNESAVV